MARASFPDVPDARRRTMAAIRGTDTRPEVAVRSMLHRLGYRFRLHARELAGRPYIVFPARRKALLIHGCFWHQHPGCRSAALPRTRQDYWHPKLARNAARDERNLLDLAAAGWEALVVWECVLKDPEATRRTLVGFLGPPGRQGVTEGASLRSRSPQGRRRAGAGSR